MTVKCMCQFTSPYMCFYCIERMKSKLGFCPHDDPSWCDEKCNKEQGNGLETTKED